MIHEFGPISDSLRGAVIDFYRQRGERLEGPAGLNTLETNSGFAERRGRVLLEILYGHTGRQSLEGMRVLDLGCGFGALCVFFAAQGATVIGIDPHEDRFQVGRSVAAEHALAVEFRRGVMQDLDLADAEFDLAVQNNSLCYVVPREERQAALSETRRVLRPGGFLIVRNPNRWHPLDQFTGLPALALLPPRAANRAAARLGRKRSLVRLTSPLEGARELRAAGFASVRHVHASSSRWPSLMGFVVRYQHFIARCPP